MANILILGAYGLLGSSLSKFLLQKEHLVYRQGRKDNAQVIINAINSKWIGVFLTEYKIDVVINLVASTDVDKCEYDPNYAFLGNVQPVNALVEGIYQNQNNTHLIHISTDHIYGGCGIHSEEDVLILNQYARSKYEGELIAQRVSSTIIRTNFYGQSQSPNRKSFSDWLVQSLIEKKPITLFNNIHFNGVHISSLCSLIERFISFRICGVFNYGTSSGISKADFGIAIAKELKLSLSDVNLGSYEPANGRANRPLNMVMDVNKIESALNIKCPSIFQEIFKTVKEYKDA
jgi:dTDP-4-dehydrorhamnose reductase